MRSPSLALADSACLRASARTFFGRSVAWQRPPGPQARPPPRDRRTPARPRRAPPLAFCLYHLLPGRQISARPLALCGPAWRLLSCHCTQRAMMSWRGSRPKMVSESWTEPASLPSRVVTFNSISRLLRSRSSVRFASNLELAGLPSFLRQRLLDGVAHADPAALGAGNGAFDEDQAALDIELNDPKVERGDAVDAHVTGHLLVLPGLARVLTATGRTDRTVRDRDAVSGAQTAEVPALHTAGKTLTDRSTGDVDELPDDKVVGQDLGTDGDHLIRGDAEFLDLPLRLDLGDRELAALRLGHRPGLTAPRNKPERDITLFLYGAVAHGLAIAELQHGHGDMFARPWQAPRHRGLLCDHSGAHRRASCSFCPLVANVIQKS